MNMVLTTGVDRATRAQRVREAVHAYFMWHTGRIPGITTDYLDTRAKNSSDMLLSDIEEVERHWTMYSLHSQLSRMDRIGLSPVITLDAQILSVNDVRSHIPVSFPEGMVPSNFCAPNEEIPLFQSVEELLRAYRALPQFLMYYYEMVMEQIEEVQRGYLGQINFQYSSSIDNVHFEPPEYIVSGPYHPKETVSQIRQSNDVGQLKRLEAQVIYTGATNTAVMTAAFKCSGTPSTPCDAVTYMIQDPYSDVLREPTACAADDEVGGCGRKKGEVIFNLLSKPDSRTITYQMIQVQDLDSEDGSPKTINVELRGSLCGEVHDGGFVTLDGILMSRPTGKGKKTREPYFFCTSIIENGKKRHVAVTDEDEGVVRQWVNARSPEQVLADLAQEFCPQIHGYDAHQKGHFATICRGTSH
jgi:DNA replicative helicase MCM subunit Mcm2 (Cdc46/Mcm family)